LDPKTGWTCWLKKQLLDINLELKPEQLKQLAEKIPAIPEVLDLKTEEADLGGLVKLYKKEVAEERLGFTTIAKAMTAGVPAYDLADSLKNVGLNISKVI